MRLKEDTISQMKLLHDAGKNADDIYYEIKQSYSKSTIQKLIRCGFDRKKYLSYNMKKDYGSHKEKLSNAFSSNMGGYSEEEIKIGYDLFVKHINPLKSVPCRCTDNLMCYPHYLKQLEYTHNKIIRE